MQINNNVIFKYIASVKEPLGDRGTAEIIEEEILRGEPILKEEAVKLIGVSPRCGCNGCDFVRYQNHIYAVKADKKSKKITQAVNFFLTF